MRKWVEVLELLSDGSWHIRVELQNELGLSEFQAALLTNFLVECGFCIYQVQEDGVAVKLRAEVLFFLEQLDKLEGQN